MAKVVGVFLSLYSPLCRSKSHYSRPSHIRPSHIRPLAYPTFRIKRKKRQFHLLHKLRDQMQGKIYKIVKILGRMNSRTVMMERFQDRVLMALLSTEDSNDSQKRIRAVLTIHPTLAYPFFSLIRPLFLRVLPKGGRICEGLLYIHI